MFRTTRTALILGAALSALTGLLAPAGLQAQANLTGSWEMQATGQIPDENMPCNFTGTANVVQSGNGLSGTADLMLTSGPPACPQEMMANIGGTVSGGGAAPEVAMGALMGGQLGTAQFSGNVRGDGNQVGGTYAVDSGPFMGTSGTWNSLRHAVAAIPTLAGVALILLAVLLLAGGYFMGRRQTHRSA